MRGVDHTRLHHTLLAWYQFGHRDLPWRHSRDPYAILVSEVMLQQTQVERVVPKYHKFLAQFPDFYVLANASKADVIRAWATLGYNRRAVRLQGVAQQVVRDFHGSLPGDLGTLRRLDGIGEYTAAAVASFAFRLDVAVVDTNVRRVLTRLFWGKERPKPRDLAGLAQELVPPGAGYEWNQALIELGATVCVSRTPKCSVCPLGTACRAAPSLRNGLPRAPESLTAYKATPFKESRRYYRGRIVNRLRLLGDHEQLPLTTLGLDVKPNFEPRDLDWLRDLAAGLESDGLTKLSPPGDPSSATHVSLP